MAIIAVPPPGWQPAEADKAFQTERLRSLSNPHVEGFPMRLLRPLALVVFFSAPGFAQAPQPPPAPDSPEAVRLTLAEARREIQDHEKSGGAAGVEHPAIKWERALWEVHGRAPGTPGGSLAAVEGIRLLANAKLYDQADARIESLGVDDAAWERLPSVIYSAGIARQDLPSVVARLSRVAASATKPSIKAASLMIVGRVHRRQGDSAAAVRVLQEAKVAAPGTPYAEEATGLIYEIEHLAVGMAAPAISAKARNGRTVSLSALRGKPVVLVFWGTT